jgi:hypothetical protein
MTGGLLYVSLIAAPAGRWLLGLCLLLLSLWLLLQGH